MIAVDKVRRVGKPTPRWCSPTARGGTGEELRFEGDPRSTAPRPCRHQRRPPPTRSLARSCLRAEAGDGNLPLTFRAERGDAAAAFKDAPYRRRERFKVQRHFGFTMEPRGVLAEWDAAAGILRVFGAAKVPFFNRRILAAQIGLPEAAIDMVENDVGGGFGARGEFYPEDFLIPFAARCMSAVRSNGSRIGAKT